MQSRDNTSFTAKTAQLLTESNKSTPVQRRVSQHLTVITQADTLCDSGINSLNSKGIRHSLQAEFLPAQKIDERPLHWQLESIGENLSENIKAYLSSDAVPKITASDHSEINDKNEFIKFTNCLIGGLRNYMAVAEAISSEDTNYDQMKMRHATLKWKVGTVSRLLQEYEDILKKIGGQNALILQAKTVPLLATPKKHSRSLNILPRKGVMAEAPVSQSPLLPALLADRSRMRVIEGQICDLAGALQLRLKEKLDGLRFASHSTNYKVKISISPHETDKGALIASLTNLSRLSPFAGLTSRPAVSNAVLHEWVLNFHSESTPFLIDKPEALIQACSNSETWRFSSTECVLPVVPGAALVTDVISSKKNRKVFELSPFLTSEPRLITIELSVLTSPYIEIEVEWLPLTQLDLFTLEKYPVSRSLAKEWACENSMEVSTQNLGSIPMVRDQQIQRPPSGKEEEHDLDGGFDSMRSESNGPTPSISSKSSITHPKCRKPLRAEHNIFFTQVPCNSGSDNSIFQQNTMNDEQEEEDFDRLRDNANNNYCEETIALEPLLESVQNEVEAINRQPNRYQALLYELSKVLQGLREQLSSSSRITANSSSHTISSRSIEGDLEKSLSMLDIVIDGSSAKFGSDVGTWAQPLTSGWNQLDSVVEWHLNHVSHLIQHLGSSNRFYTSSSDMDNDSDSNLLCITEDLLAMALDAQSEILSDITGLVLSYVEERDPFKVFINSHCLAYCGNDQRAPLFPISFWSRFVWHTPLSVSGFSSLDGTLRPTLMIRRTSLHKFLFQEYGALDTDDEDKQTLDSAIDNLIDKLMDLDLMDISIWDKIPLTQLCNRLKLLNFQILPKFDGQNRKLGYHNNRSGNSLTRSALNAEPSISLALNYLIKQGKLQHELRESDEELLFRSLETLVDNLAVSNEATNRRSELMALSVENFICLAHILESEDDSLTVYAGRAIHALEDLTHSAYGVILQSNPLPFLRTAGPCCALLKELDVFWRKVQRRNSRLSCGSITNPVSGYNMISPVGAAILWAMQCPVAEDYRTAALAAWECFSAPMEIGLGRPSGRPQSHHYQQQSRNSRVNGRVADSDGDQGPIQAEVRRMNLADDSAKVRRMALRILISRQKCRSIACSLDTSR